MCLIHVSHVRRCCIERESHLGVSTFSPLLRRAVSQMCQIGYPWQYRQPAFVRSKLWTANFLLRTMFLNKIFPKLFGQQVSRLIDP